MPWISLLFLTFGALLMRSSSSFSLPFPFTSRRGTSTTTASTTTVSKNAPLVPVPSSSRPSSSSSIRRTMASSSDNNNNLFDNLRNFFQDMNRDDNNDSISNNKAEESQPERRRKEEEDDEDLPAGTTRVFTLPVQSIKPGGLRLFLMLYLMGMQNTPSTNTWKFDQPTREKDEYVLDYWFHDQSAVLTVTLTQSSITLDRVGSQPSTSYIMQEAVMAQGILDELHLCAFDESVALEHRLLRLAEPNAIETARDALAFG